MPEREYHKQIKLPFLESGAPSSYPIAAQGVQKTAPCQRLHLEGLYHLHILSQRDYSLMGSCKLVAIKCMMKSRLGKQAQDNLVSEISILKTLEHPHIVCMLDFTWDASYVYIIMEFCGGGDLGRFLKQKRKLDELLVQHFLQQLGKSVSIVKSVKP
ncbi:unnamed protein product [Trichobilharzia regenti]|nr:unnamed protein product [Trichobilharzia regenti]